MDNFDILAIQGINPDSGADAADFSALDATTLQGDGNSPPIQSDVDWQSPTSNLQKLGSTDWVAASRDAGVVVGNFQKTVTQARDAFNNARGAAASTAPLSGLQTWWQYASTTDKLVVGLAAATLIYMIVKD